MAKTYEGKMEAYNNCGMTAKFMAMLCKVNQSTIGRHIQSYDIHPLPSSSKRNCRYRVSEIRKVLGDFVKSRHPIASNKKVHAFCNFKGGTGKTTISYQIATHLALCGYKVLAIDADAQSHLTVTFGFADNLKLSTLFDGLINNLSPEEIILNIFEGLDLIPGNLSLTNIDIRLREIPRQEDVLKRYIASLKDHYDFIIFDCNPSMSLLNRNILNCSDVLDIVCETHPYSVNGMKIMMDDLKNFYTLMQADQPEIIIVPNKYEDRSNSSAEAMAVLNKFYNEFLIPDFAVRKCEDFPKSAREQQPISFFCKSNSIAFEDICDLLRVIISKSSIEQENISFIA